ncbi:uncharacterized protein L199_001463 [Kwoniella botswanensis]|uniref:uncharacterized protein n=1 Tax=Kwoniella botswanensis TaxID=1268659 RepID=UPI00315DA77C
MVDLTNAEAGPSQPRPKPLLPTRPIPDPPPATPPSTSKSAKRRSWFGLGLGSPSVITSPTNDNNASPTKKDRRKSTSSIHSSREGLELDHIARDGKGEGKDSLGKEGGSEANEEELLTIDGDPEKTIKKKKKRRSKGDNDDDFEVMRMKDLSGSNQQTPRSASERTVKVDSDERHTPQSFTIRQRTFSRTASDRDPFSPPEPTSFPPNTPASRSSSSSVTNHRPDIQPRTSSRSSSSYSPSRRILSLQIEKNQPPIPIDVDRPLPPLPLKNTSSSTSMKPPVMPRGIVVTPSSPRKLSKTPKKPSLTQRRSRSATGHSRIPSLASNKRSHSNSPNPSIILNNTPGSKIGLGLPSALLPSAKSNTHTESPPPPPVPSKPQSVSSPFPSRSPSPIPKIAFVEPDGIPAKHEDVSLPPSQQEEKRKVIRRARSLSGFFGKSPPIPPGTEVEEPMPVPEQRDSDSGESVGKSGGVLEWLGVKKAVRRKTSDTQMKSTAGDSVPAVIDHSEGVAGQQQQTASRESLEPPRNVEHAVSESQQPTPRRPQPNLSPSTATSLPTTGQSKISSIFSRRSSTKTTDDEGEPPKIQVVPMAIPNAGMRNQTAQSSESSFNLPTHDPISPFIPGSGPWVATPQSEKEESEVLFSTPEAEISNWGPGRRPWMDGAERHNSSKSSSISSPLDSLPEQGLPPSQSPFKAPPTFREGRVRSWSDAPLPPQKLVSQSSNPHLPLPRPITPNSQSPSLSLSASPRTPSRPKLGDRSNSGNSAIIGRMKSVFSKSTNRSRSSSLLGKGSKNAEIDEFGNIPMGGDAGRSQRMRPSTSSSSMASSGALRGRSIGDDSGRPGVEELQTRSPRTSFTPSIASFGSTTRQEETKAQRKNRVRASTISLAPTAYHFAPPRPSSPNLFPIAATPPRRRPGTIHRISNGLFGSGSSGPSSPKTSSLLFPLPARSSGSMSSSTGGGMVGWEDTSGTSTTNGPLSPGTSPRLSTGSITAAMTNSMIKQISQRQDEESPKAWLERIVNNVQRDEIANVLASSGDEFHTEALQLYLSTFDFTHNALDVALRRLLMHMSLPKETQQIDRVIEAFSKRYEECEPGLFGHKDNTYVLAFSMMMLHTDAFNKSNKNKMTKVDYVRNTRMEGVSPIVLEAFFDNITYTPFIFIEDDMNLKRSSGYESSSSTFGPSTPTFTNNPLPSSVTSTGGMSMSTSGKAKVDVYHMIVRGLLGTLRVNNIENQISPENPFSYRGTRPFLNLDILCQAFANANNLIIPSYITTNPVTSVGGKLTTPSRRNTVGAKDQKMEDLVLRVVKVGLLSRKDESDQSSKKASRKWKSWSVILTSSQLLFFKDPTWALTLLEQIQSLRDADDESGQLLLPRQTSFKPDEVFSLKDCVAVFDRTFTAYPNTFRFVMPQSRQYLLQSSDEYEMNEWIGLINYASAFKTVNLKMKGPTMRKDQVVLAGAAAAASHKRELKGAAVAAGGGNMPPLGSGRKAFFGESDPPSNTTSDENGTGDTNDQGLRLIDHHSTISQSNGNPRKKVKNGNIDVDGPDQVVHEGEQLEEVFGVVKAELAAGRGEAGSNRPSTSIHLVQEKTPVKMDPRHIHTSRVSLIYEHLNTLREKCQPIEGSLRSSLILVRNISLLTPFQKSTRDKISSSIPSLAHKIRNDRLNLTKLRLWIKVLEHEGEREDREWKVVRHVALQAAARSLREDSLAGVVKDVNNAQGIEKEVPKLEISDPNHSESSSPSPPSSRGANADAEERNSRGEMTSPVELPEIIRRSSEEPLSVDPEDAQQRRKPSKSDQLNRNTAGGINSAGVGMRKSNSANDLLNPNTFIQSRRSSEIEETPRPHSGSASETYDLSHSPNLSVDTPMMMFTMESPLEIPSEKMAEQDEGQGKAGAGYPNKG